jgi:polar amino acid transport system substrate-binding protein
MKNKLLCKAFSSIVAYALLQFGGYTAAIADSLDDIQKRGRLIVGVKKDVVLWGSVDPSTGQLVGLEIDLAKNLAEKLGVKVELIGLLSAERIEAVEQRKVDVLIATLSDTPERNERLTLALPHYYSSGANILARKSDQFKAWDELRNRRICSRRGAFYNRPVTVEYGADIVALYGNNLLKASLSDGKCAAYLYDDTAILAMLKETQWSQQFEMPLPTIYPTPWSVALHKSEKASRFEQIVSETIIDWHRSGFLKTTQSNWGIPSSNFVVQMNAIWNKKVNSRWYCGEQVTPNTPRDCL